MQNLLILILTYKCNLNCTYCPTIKIDASMDWGVAKRSLDLFGRLKGDSYEIKFFGGEPLLEFDLIKKTVEYNEIFDKTFEYELTTNGILLDDKKIEFFKKNDFKLHVSIDGDKQTQITERGIQSWNVFHRLKEDDKKFVFINVVVSPKQVNKFYENFKFLFSHGFKKFNILPAFFNEWNKKGIVRFHEELEKVARFIRIHDDIYLKNKDVNKNDYLFNEGLVIDYNGDIYNTNNIMIHPYNALKKNIRLGNILNLQNFGGLNKNIQTPEIDSEGYEMNLKLDAVLTNFVESF